MTQIVRSNFQNHPFHLVSPSPWPINTSSSLFILTTTGVLSMQKIGHKYCSFHSGFTGSFTNVKVVINDMSKNAKLLKIIGGRAQEGPGKSSSINSYPCLVITRFHSCKTSKSTSFSLMGNLRKTHPKVISAKGIYVNLEDKRKILDASSGAAVTCLGRNNKRVNLAIIKVLRAGITYVPFWSSDLVEQLAKELIEGTDGKMARAYFIGSGSEALDTALKLARQFFFEKDKSTLRTKIIAREFSYHGATLAALSASGHIARREPYTSILMNNVYHISACNPYRQRKEGESDADFVARKAAELENLILELDPNTVMAFIAEPVVGAALGCVPFVPGYLAAMKKVCEKYGVLLILDEVMCGIGRTGFLHAWQIENVIPDIQMIAKGLGGGYQPIAAVLASEKIVNVILQGKGEFVHGHTYEAMPVTVAAALEVQRIIREKKLLNNVSKQGVYLEKLLKAALSDHPNVGDIRGLGLFWGIEFVENKATKKPFDPKLGITQKIVDLAASSEFNMTVYPGTGTVDGVYGDHIMLAPPFIIKKKDVRLIVNVLAALIHRIFN